MLEMDPTVCPTTTTTTTTTTTCDAILRVAHTLQSALEMGQEVRMVQIDFSAAFEGSTIQGFSSSYALWELEVQCCLF